MNCLRRSLLAVVPERVAVVEAVARHTRMLEELDRITDDASRGAVNCLARLGELREQASALASSSSISQRLIGGAGRSGLALDAGTAAAVNGPKVRPYPDLSTLLLCGSAREASMCVCTVAPRCTVVRGGARGVMHGIVPAPPHSPASQLANGLLFNLNLPSLGEHDAEALAIGMAAELRSGIAEMAAKVERFNIVSACITLLRSDVTGSLRVDNVGRAVAAAQVPRVICGDITPQQFAAFALPHGLAGGAAAADADGDGDADGVGDEGLDSDAEQEDGEAAEGGAAEGGDQGAHGDDEDDQLDGIAEGLLALSSTSAVLSAVST